MTHKPEVIQSLARLLRLLPAATTRSFAVLMLGAGFVALVETGALGLIALFASAVTNPLMFQQADVLARLPFVAGGADRPAPQALLLVLGIGVVVIVALKNCLRAILQRRQSGFVALASGRFSTWMLSSFLRMPYQQLLRENSSDLMNAVSWAPNCGTFLGHVFLVFTETVLLVFMATAVVAANPMVVFYSSLLLGVPAFLIMKALRRRVDAAATALTDHRNDAYRSLMIALQGVKDVKAYGQEAAFCQRYSMDAEASFSMQARTEFLLLLPSLLLESVGFMLLCFTAFLMYYIAEDSPVRATGTIALLAVTAWRGLPAAMRVVSSINAFRSLLPYVRRTLDYAERLARLGIAPPEEALRRVRPVFAQELRAEGLGFRYEGAQSPVLQGISFRVTRGETVGIVGESGAGKSTLMDLLMGLLVPTDGALSLDGRPLDNFGRLGLAEIIGYVPQSPYIFDATMEENVAFGEHTESIDRERLESACRMAAVNEFLEGLPEGFATPMGERGVRLSGGQQQRVCIARALYRRPEILIFDEATSSLDTRSEKQIQQTILGLKGKVTMVIVAHRLSTVAGCDSLVWLENGRVRMTGTPKEVLPLYRRALARLDSGGSGEGSA